MKTNNEKINLLMEHQRETALLRSSLSLLHWDQETYMPPKALEWRAQQISQLSGLIHDREASTQVAELLDGLGCTKKNPQGQVEGDLEKALLKQSFKGYHQANCFPREYVMEKSATLSQSHAAWAEAREKDDFSIFKPWLEKVMDYAKQDAEYLGYEEHPYDALLDLYEPEMTTKELKSLFDPLGKELAELVNQISQAEQVPGDFLTKAIPVKQQEAIGLRVLKDMGYSMDVGRLDVTAHPFTIELGPKDVRITTAYKENLFETSLYGTIHEGGHALYELGVDPEIQGTILGTGVSLGIHESQSRYWENLIGRSRSFGQYLLPQFKKLVPEVFSGLDDEAFYKGINRVSPGFIRIESDEVCYSLHVILRFNLELALLEGRLAVADLPDAWREESKKLLGVVPPSDKEGVLQDIHWSGGSVGYFPTYALGNLYGAQFLRTMEQDIPDWQDQVSQGKLLGVKDWLQKNIHCHGAAIPAGELVREVTGQALNGQYFVDYLKNKYNQIYRLEP